MGMVSKLKKFRVAQNLLLNMVLCLSEAKGMTIIMKKTSKKILCSLVCIMCINTVAYNTNYASTNLNQNTSYRVFGYDSNPTFKKDVEHYVGTYRLKGADYYDTKNNKFIIDVYRKDIEMLNDVNSQYYIFDYTYKISKARDVLDNLNYGSIYIGDFFELSNPISRKELESNGCSSLDNLVLQERYLCHLDGYYKYSNYSRDIVNMRLISNDLLPGKPQPNFQINLDTITLDNAPLIKELLEKDRLSLDDNRYTKLKSEFFESYPELFDERPTTFYHWTEDSFRYGKEYYATPLDGKVLKVPGKLSFKSNAQHGSFIGDLSSTEIEIIKDKGGDDENIPEYDVMVDFYLTSERGNYYDPKKHEFKIKDKVYQNVKCVYLLENALREEHKKAFEIQMSNYIYFDMVTLKFESIQVDNNDSALLPIDSTLRLLKEDIYVIGSYGLDQRRHKKIIKYGINNKGKFYTIVPDYENYYISESSYDDLAKNLSSIDKLTERELQTLNLKRESYNNNVVYYTPYLNGTKASFSAKPIAKDGVTYVPIFETAKQLKFYKIDAESYKKENEVSIYLTKNDDFSLCFQSKPNEKGYFIPYENIDEPLLYFKGVAYISIKDFNNLFKTAISVDTNKKIVFIKRK